MSSDKTNTNHLELARSDIHDAVGKLESAENYLTRRRSGDESYASTAEELVEIGRLIARAQRVSRRLLNAAHASVSLMELRR